MSGLSCPASHQLVRHNNGITFHQQSQRYYAFKEGDFPSSSRKRGCAGPGSVHRVHAACRTLYDEALKAGMPAEDARFLLPNAASTNITFTVNFEEFLHIADLRLCWRAHWEIRHRWAKCRNALKAKFPELARVVQPKCWDQRMGYCDEPMAEYLKWPLGARLIRLHKEQIIAAAKEARTLESTPLTEADMALLAPRGRCPPGRVVCDLNLSLVGEVVCRGRGSRYIVAGLSQIVQGRPCRDARGRARSRVPGSRQSLNVCPSCETIFFRDPKLVVIALIEQDGQVLLVQRDIEPGRGL